ncbi:MAG TPA: hypothetical protein VF779_10510 [Pyrinomonadaceae bacterium]
MMRRSIAGPLPATRASDTSPTGGDQNFSGEQLNPARRRARRQLRLARFPLHSIPNNSQQIMSAGRSCELRARSIKPRVPSNFCSTLDWLLIQERFQ